MDNLQLRHCQTWIFSNLDSPDRLIESNLDIVWPGHVVTLTRTMSEFPLTWTMSELLLTQTISELKFFFASEGGG